MEVGLEGGQRCLSAFEQRRLCALPVPGTLAKEVLGAGWGLPLHISDFAADGAVTVTWRDAPVFYSRVTGEMETWKCDVIGSHDSSSDEAGLEDAPEERRVP